ncbi:hypothetical protein K458DRAFT_414979 [Lentithecium fluviatile CBS 122367]|uniref:Transcription factor IIIC putative zinc-finger domain-containing protein n=1 Tax=Lentithecium fluviatile CBS 122367 TaxID=1168545 RepID=A0A6G1JCP8_9PLEO|nr:hypothetical protein K458DRAFT_414979 [Lentithecium fluviatile CBS 122367]
MSDVSELRFWPCCNDAIDWSYDGIIAAAEEEHVELLFPNTEPDYKEQGDTSWQYIEVPVTWFTREELPLKLSAPFRNCSIGEETSPSLPMKISWSPPGLAKHRRCALGILTSSLNLSIWSTDGKVKENSGWKRRLIVNDALAEYFSGDTALEESALTSRKQGKVRLRSRVRDFAWAPILPPLQACGTVGTQLAWGQHIVAICNDDNQVIFTLINSPTTTLGRDERWNAKVVNHFAVTPDPNSIFSEVPTTFDEIMQQQRFISHVAWSPWIVCDDRYHSVLAYSTNEEVRARIVKYTHKIIEFGDEVIFARIDLRNNGAMKWSPGVVDRNKLTLAMFAHSTITCLTVSATDASIITRASDNPDNRWDETSGIVWDHPQNSLAHVHFSSFGTTTTSATSAFEVSENGSLSVLSPNWPEQIKDSRALFSIQNELKGHVKSKIWGLCASPLGDFIASCHTLHPSHMIEYGPPATRRCTIALNRLRGFSQPSIHFPAGNVSAEAIMFTIRKWLDNTVEDTDRISEFTDQVFAKIMEVYGPTDSSTDSDRVAAYESGDLVQMLQEFKRDAILNSQSVEDRYTILISRTCTPDSKYDLERALIAYRLAAATQKLPASLSRTTSFSSEILSTHRQVTTLISTLMEVSPGTEDVSSDPAAILLINTAPGLEADICDLCDAVIPFTDLTMASCMNGHQYQRCGLSFLAIQAPRISKTCGICNTPFLRDEFIAAQEVESRLGSQTEMGDAGGYGRRDGEDASGAGNAEQRVGAIDVEGGEERPVREGMNGNGNGGGARAEVAGKDYETGVPPVSLARFLFLACDVCIYCGGKFAG